MVQGWFFNVKLFDCTYTVQCNSEPTSSNGVSPGVDFFFFPGTQTDGSVSLAGEFSHLLVTEAAVLAEVRL